MHCAVFISKYNDDMFLSIFGRRIFSFVAFHWGGGRQREGKRWSLSKKKKTLCGKDQLNVVSIRCRLTTKGEAAIPHLPHMRCAQIWRLARRWDCKIWCPFGNSSKTQVAMPRGIAAHHDAPGECNVISKNVILFERGCPQKDILPLTTVGRDAPTNAMYPWS